MSSYSYTEKSLFWMLPTTIKAAMIINLTVKTEYEFPRYANVTFFAYIDYSVRTGVFV
jgi:hypothetical protein